MGSLRRVLDPLGIFGSDKKKSRPRSKPAAETATPERRTGGTTPLEEQRRRRAATRQSNFAQSRPASTILTGPSNPNDSIL